MNNFAIHTILKASTCPSQSSDSYIFALSKSSSRVTRHGSRRCPTGFGGGLLWGTKIEGPKSRPHGRSRLSSKKGVDFFSPKSYMCAHTGGWGGGGGGEGPRAESLLQAQRAGVGWGRGARACRWGAGGGSYRGGGSTLVARPIASVVASREGTVPTHT